MGLDSAEEAVVLGSFDDSVQGFQDVFLDLVVFKDGVQVHLLEQILNVLDFLLLRQSSVQFGDENGAFLNFEVNDKKVETFAEFELVALVFPDELDVEFVQVGDAFQVNGFVGEREQVDEDDINVEFLDDLLQLPEEIHVFVLDLGHFPFDFVDQVVELNHFFLFPFLILCII